MSTADDFREHARQRAAAEIRRAKSRGERERLKREAQERALAAMRVEIPGYSPIARLHPGAVRWRGSESAGWRGKGQN